MDHMTPISIRTHTSEPVPALIYDSRHTTNGCGRSFSEKECHEEMHVTGKNVRRGHLLMNSLLEHIDSNEDPID